MKMTMICGDPLVLTLMKKAPGSFRPGALLTSEAFVSGKDRKLNLGSTFNCLACDMESGVYAFIGNTLASKPWFNIRVVADTMDDSLGEYFAMEKNMTEILGNGVVEILKILDTLIKYSFMLDAKSLGL
jgi:nucleoside phosphorylase